MARKVRLEYPGALYHVINRGNYRFDLFATEGAKRAFLECMAEACLKSEWILHGYVVMRNHYHLALETPKGNLVDGMKWLQGTFANRFNRFRSEHGHVFQGRYQAIILEDDDALAAVVHYQHLNPVKAHIVSVERLPEYQASSFIYYQKAPKQRPPWLKIEAVLTQIGQLADTKKGRLKYWDYLKWLAEEKSEQKNLRFEELCQGWALGTKAFKRTLIETHREQLELRGHGREKALQEAKEIGWEQTLTRCHAAIKSVSSETCFSMKSAAWKIAIATRMKEITTVKNQWLGKRLAMGPAESVSRYVCELKKGKRPEAFRLYRRITRVVV